MAAKKKARSDTSDSTPATASSQDGSAKSDRNRNDARSDGPNIKRPEGKYMEDYFKEFVVLARPLAVWSRPDGNMGIVNSIEEVIFTTLYALIDPDMSPITFRVPNEIERFARATAQGKQINVVIGTHLEHHVVTRQPKSSKKTAPGPNDVLPLEELDAPTVIFHWLNRQKLPRWAILQKTEPAARDGHGH